MGPPDQGAILVGALIAGIACGMVPLIMGFVKRRPAAGVGGFVTCLILGFLCGFLLAVPASLAFSFFIWYLGSAQANAMSGNAGLSEADYQRERRRMLASRRRAAEVPDPRTFEQPYTEIGPAVVCNSCRQSTSKGSDGSVPLECPTCGLRFGSRRASGVTRRAGPRTARLTEDDLVELQPVDEPSRR